MNQPIYYRSRIALFNHLIEKLPVDKLAKKNTPRELLKQGYWDNALGDQEQQVSEFKSNSADIDNSVLRLSELTTYSTWFAMHPEKIAGKEKVTTSLFFPVKIEGTESDIKAVIKQGLNHISGKTEPTNKLPNLLKMRMKAKALKLKLSLTPAIPESNYIVTRHNTDLEKEYDKYNKLVFDNKLIQVPLQWGLKKDKLGCVCSHGYKNDLKSFIVDYLEISLFSKIDYKVFVNTLVHEMIHVYIITNAIRDNDSHGREFHKEMNRINAMNIGIYISVTGDTSGFEISDEISAKEYVVTLISKEGDPAGITLYNKALYNDVPRWYDNLSKQQNAYKFKHVLSKELFLNHYKVHNAFTLKYNTVNQDNWNKLQSSRALEGINSNLEEIRYITVY